MTLGGYARLIRSRKLKAEQWVLTTNYRRIKPRDLAYIYTGDDTAGIVGFAVVRDVSEPLDRRADIALQIDFPLSSQLVAARPIPASLVRQWLHDQKLLKTSRLSRTSLTAGSAR